MARIVPRHSKKAGLRPGAVVYVGRDRTQKVEIDCIRYDAENLTEQRVERPDDCFPLVEAPTVNWLKVYGIHDVSVIEHLGEKLGLHPLITEDIANTAVRPTVEDLGDKIVVILKRLILNEKDASLGSEQMTIIFTANAVISFQEREGSPFEAVRDRLKKTVPRVRFMNSDYLAYTLMDALVDDYFVTLEQVGDKLESIQDELVKNPKPGHLQTIFEIKRELLVFRRAVWPLREAIGNLSRTDSSLIHDTTDPYLRDLYDHTIQVIDTVETLRDMAAGLLDIYLSSVSNRMNEVMKVLTIIGVIFIPLGFLAGVYGMNFDRSVSAFNLPELGFKYGYPLFWLVVIGVALSLVAFFKKKNWM